MSHTLPYSNAAIGEGITIRKIRRGWKGNHDEVLRQMIIKVKAHCDVTLFKKHILMFTGKNTQKKSTKMLLLVQSEWYDLIKYK